MGILRACVGVALACAAALAQEAPTKVERALASGGRVELHLEAGDYEIQPSSENRLSVSLQGRHAARTRVEMDGGADHAWVRVSHPSHTDVKAVIKVPEACDLQVRLSAGDLRIGAVKGSKHVRLRAGNLEIRVPDPQAYGQVHASVSAGDISAGAFHVAKSGLFRSFSWKGPGRHSLEASLLAGDLILEP